MQPDSLPIDPCKGIKPEMFCKDVNCHKIKDLPIESYRNIDYNVDSFRKL
jgi:hypothetical protein